MGKIAIRVWFVTKMAQNLDQLAGIFEQNQQDLVCPISSMFGGSFWDGDCSGMRALYNCLLPYCKVPMPHTLSNSIKKSHR